MTDMFFGFLLLAAMVVGMRLLLEPASVLHLGLFRPYRGLTWPMGVQEEDVVKFSWQRRKPPIGTGPNGPVAFIWATAPSAMFDEPEAPVIEEGAEEPVVLVVLPEVHVHRASH